MSQQRHLCQPPPGQEWATCIQCDGRIHLDGCTSRRNKERDCCRARHEMLYLQGQTRGIWDRSLPMLKPDEVAALDARAKRHK